MNYDSMVPRGILILLACVTPSYMSCSKPFTSPTGTLTSPNYPKKYPPNQDCTTTITGPANTRLILSFIDFRLESHCRYDYVQILGVSETIDGDKYCGNQPALRLISRSNNVTINFRSGGRHETRGFKINWRTADQFTYHTTPMSWTDAMATCAAEGATLVRNNYVTRTQLNLPENKPNFTESWTSEYLTPWIWFKGCLLVASNVQIGTPIRFKNNRMTVCQRHCSSSNYFAVQEDQCICLDDFEGNFVRPDLHCRSLCPNSSSERCGELGKAYTVYMNDMCVTNTTEWTGTVAQTIGGKKCDAWTKYYTHPDSMDTYFPDGSILNASNHCRDPDRQNSLWCYSGGHRHLCDVPRCFARSISETVPTLCLLFEIKNWTVSARQTSCSSYHHYITPSVQQDAGNVNYILLLSKRRWRWHNAWYDLTNNKAYHTVLLTPDVPTTVPFWREITRRRTHSSYTDYALNPADCYKMSLIDGRDTPTHCHEPNPFVCQKATLNCGETLDSESGTIVSPDYPDHYGIFLNCEWKVHVTPGHTIRLFVDFDIEQSYKCQSDSITVVDGSNPVGEPRRKWCGNDSIVIDSSKNQITLSFRTDESVSSKGFKAKWTAVSTAGHTTHALGGNKNKDNNERTETTEEPGQSVTLYAAIAAVAVVIVLILLGIFLTRRYRARKTERAMGDKSKQQVHCTSTNTNGRLELHVTNTALFHAGEDDLTDGVYDNPDFHGCTPTTEEADVYNHTDHSRAINNKPRNEQTMASDGANIYDHTKMDTQTPHDNLENKNSTGDVYDHTGTLTTSRSGACKAAPGEDVYNTTSPQNVVHKDDTYNTLDQSFAEDDTYNHTLPRSKTHKDDTYNTFGQSFAEDDTYNSTLPRNNIHKDDTYNTLDQSFADDDTYSHTLQRSQAHKDDTYNSLDQFADVDDTYQNTLPRKQSSGTRTN